MLAEYTGDICVVQFGKFKGSYLCEVPSWYLEFMIDLWEPDCDDEDMFDFVEAMIDELTGRDYVQY